MVLTISRPATHTPPAPASAPDGWGVAVSAHAVAKAFGQRGVLRALDLEAAPGEFVAIVGRSGCGKSTILRLLAGLEERDGGTLTIDGEEPRPGNPLARMMFQDARLLPWRRVIDNVALACGGDKTRAAETLSEVGLGDRGGDWPGVLSGGQKQRVALARALVGQPRLLLLDEPLGALDALTRIEMQGLIERIWLTHGFTALLVTHDVAEAVALADRVVVLDGGKVALDLPVLLPRPRRRGDHGFADAEERVLDRVLGAGAGANQAPVGIAEPRVLARTA